jgi:hypothetical protein
MLYIEFYYLGMIYARRSSASDIRCCAHTITKSFVTDIKSPPFLTTLPLNTSSEMITWMNLWGLQRRVGVESRSRKEPIIKTAKKKILYNDLDWKTNNEYYSII